MSSDANRAYRGYTDSTRSRRSVCPHRQKPHGKAESQRSAGKVYRPRASALPLDCSVSVAPDRRSASRAHPSRRLIQSEKISVSTAKSRAAQRPALVTV